MKVLFVCVANEHRSQVAEAIFNKFSRRNHAISVGLKPKRVGALLRSHFVAAMEEAGYDLSKAGVKRVNKKMADSAAKLVLVFERKHPQDVPAHLRNRSAAELWEAESISDKASTEDYPRLERKRIREIGERVEELMNRLESRG